MFVEIAYDKRRERQRQITGCLAGEVPFISEKREETEGGEAQYK